MSRQLFDTTRAVDPRLYRAPLFELELEKQRNNAEFVHDEGVKEREELVGRNRYVRGTSKRNDTCVTVLLRNRFTA